MKKKFLVICLFAAMILPLCAACSGKAPESETKQQTYADFIGGDKSYGVQIGDIYDSVVREKGWCDSPQLLQSVNEIAESVRLGKIDVGMMTEDAVPALADSGAYGDLEFLPIPYDVLRVESAPIFNKAALAEQFDDFINVITENGVFDEMNARYLDGLPAYEDIPKFEFTGENGTLTVADTGNYPPMSYMSEGGEIVGYGIELASRFALYLGMDLKVMTMSYDGVLPSVVSGKCDMSACFYVITEERKEDVVFGAPVLTLGAVMAVKKQSGAVVSSEKTYTDYMGKKLSILTGSVFDEVADRVFNASEKLYFNTTVDELQAVKLGKTDAALLDSVVAAQSLHSDEFSMLTSIPVPLEELNLEYGVFSSKQEIIDKYNVFLAEIKSNGILAEMQERWLISYAYDAVMPDIPLNGENGTLKVAIMATYPPFTFAAANGEYAGFDIEQMRRFAAWLGMEVEFIDMDFGAMLPFVATGKADIGASVYITEERRAEFCFGDPDYVSETVLVIKGQNENNSSETVRDYTWFSDKQIASVIGTTGDEIISKINAKTVYYQDITSAIEDIKNGRVSGVVWDYSAANVFIRESGNEKLEVFPISEEIFSGPMGAFTSFERQDLIDEFNAFLAISKENGVLEEMKSRWLESDSYADTPMPSFTYTGEKGVLKVATSGTSVPFDYVGSNGELKGFAVELMNRFASHEGYIPEYSQMELSGLIAAVAGGRADILTSNVYITAERAESGLFSDPYFYDQYAVIALKQSEGNKKPSYTDFYNKTLAVKNGTIYDALSTELMHAETTLFFEDYPSIYEAVRSGKADAGMRNYIAAKMSLFDSNYSELDLITLPENLRSNPLAAISMDQDIIDCFNVFLEELKDDGTYSLMCAKWLDSFDPRSIPSMPKLEYEAQNGTLTVAISSDYMPFSFLSEGGENIGFDIELITRYAASIGKEIKFVDMAFSGMLPYVVSGKADIAISDITITEERKQSVLFTDPYYIDLSSIVYRKDYLSTVKTETEKTGFLAWLKTGIERNLITEGRWKMIANGLGVTMTISVLAQLLGTILGAFLCWILTRKNKLVRGIGELYSGLIHGLPMVVLLMISYYIIFGKSDISAILIAVCAFALVEAASVALNLKGAIETVDPVEIEAARSVGFSAFGAFRTVTLPQAIKRVLPSYCNGFIELVKATAIVGYIAIQDMTRAGDIIRSRTYDAFFPLLFVALIYLIVTTLCVQLFKLVVKKINREVI